MPLDFDRANVSLSTQQNILSNKFKEKGRGERGWVQKRRMKENVRRFGRKKMERGEKGFL